MNKVSLREWILFLTLFPTVIVGVLLGILFASDRTSDLKQGIEEKTQIIAEAISQSTAHAIEIQNFQGINIFANLLHNDNSEIVRTVFVYDIDNKSILSTSQRYSPRSFRYEDGPIDTMVQHKKIIDGGYALYKPIRHLRPSIDGMPSFERLYGYLVINVTERTIAAKQLDMLFSSLVSLMLASIICSLFSRKLMRMLSVPIKDMNKTVLSIREGILSARAEKVCEGEIEFLRIGINNMAQAIQDYQLDLEENIDQATLDMRETLERFEAQNVELDLERKNAQQASQVKSEFLANMSHELRTPLNGVIGFTKQVLKTPLSDNQREFLTTIDGSANNLLSIINDILDFSKLDSGHMVIEKIPFSFRNSIDEVIILLSQQAHQKNLELSVNINADIPNSLIGDAMRVKQVVINLLGNAIKFTEKGSITVDINYELLEDLNVEITIIVTDTGIGINEAQQESLFEAFGQADKSITRLYGGTGLGLIIAKHLAQEMSGDISFNSQQNHGSEFTFKFQCELNQLPIDDIILPTDLINKSILYYEPHPHSRLATIDILNSWKMQVTAVTSLQDLTLKQHLKNYDFALLGFTVTATNIDDIKNIIQALKPSVEQIHIAINNSSLNLKDTFINAGASSCISKPITSTILDKYLSTKTKKLISKNKAAFTPEKLPIKVLAVDDNEANLKLMTTLLAEKVEHIVTATNGREALLLCQKETFAIIFMDVQMPIMDGVTATQKIKLDSMNLDTSIIAVTAHAMPGEKNNLIESGFDGYMTKPVDETMLTHLIYEHTNIELPHQGLVDSHSQLVAVQTESEFIGIFDWNLALSRAANKPELAAEMLTMLVASLPATKSLIEQNMKQADLPSLGSEIHKLNGACCYNGVPSLEKISLQIESNIKSGFSCDDIEPELLELFDEIDKILESADAFFQQNHIQELIEN
ncbi:two-component sensor histidine kinase BarA [Thalassomonas sp. M1454]|uniref:two-component sensor histidine kinase BarA n=1 Tax=Thalassomonas sp. M1454 TaxID=2594477 RepID=UPI00118124B1|nr:two-component sensor histidine kinase BarA [Thalassomonas sp. M1454]TRX55829.1 two-component sensor histidine kinase BarA [Thalassomonas sp. M1454]